MHYVLCMVHLLVFIDHFIYNGPLFNINNIQQFKDDYIGRIVISSGKVATDTSNNEGNWEIKYDKDGITIEDAVPTIQLSRTKKDKEYLVFLGTLKEVIQELKE